MSNNPTNPATDERKAVEREAAAIDPVAAYLAAKPGQRLIAYEIAALIGTALEGLKPFAEVADEYDVGEDDSFEVWIDAGPQKLIRSSFELGKYRRAREAYRTLAAIRALKSQPATDERKAVVEWLRSAGPDRDNGGPCRHVEHVQGICVCSDLADAIERGDHLLPREASR